LQETTQEDYESVYKVNVFAVANLTISVALFAKRVVVTISSMRHSRQFEVAGLAAYSSSKEP
jgi:NAD(P)-dependent dehydrogenase (short-subunit alcohol dehydrogenase family)